MGEMEVGMTYRREELDATRLKMTKEYKAARNDYFWGSVLLKFTTKKKLLSELKHTAQIVKAYRKQPQQAQAQVPVKE